MVGWFDGVVRRGMSMTGRAWHGKEAAWYKARDGCMTGAGVDVGGKPRVAEGEQQGGEGRLARRAGNGEKRACATGRSGDIPHGRCYQAPPPRRSGGASEEGVWRQRA